jgi:hypothetical protein
MEAHILFYMKGKYFTGLGERGGEYERSVLLIGEEYLAALFRLLEHNN